MSELGPDVAPSHGTFPRRNRIISGLADATVVVEAPARSGALITASWALEQGRECFLVPGAIDAPASAGCLAFLREFPERARIVAGIPQLIDDLGLADHLAEPGVSSEAAATLADVGAAAGRIGRELVLGRTTVDELVAVTGWPVASVLAASRCSSDAVSPSGSTAASGPPAASPWPTRRSFGNGRGGARDPRPGPFARLPPPDDRCYPRSEVDVPPGAARAPPSMRPPEHEQERLLHKAAVALLAVPIIVAVYIGALLRRSTLARVGLAIGLSLLLGIGLISVGRTHDDGRPLRPGRSSR